jgi:hypothetical protein
MIEIVDHDERWPIQFEILRERCSAVLTGLPRRMSSISQASRFLTAAYSALRVSSPIYGRAGNPRAHSDANATICPTNRTWPLLAVESETDAMTESQVVYEQALETVRSVTNQVVSTGGIFVVGFVTVIGFSFTNRSTLLLAASSMFMVVLWALLRRWQLILWGSLEIAEAHEPAEPSLAANLTAWVGRPTDSAWSRPRWKVRAPLIVAAITLIAAAIVGILIDNWSAAGNPV